MNPLDVPGHRGCGWTDCVGLCGSAENPPPDSCAPDIGSRGPPRAGTLGCSRSDHQREPWQALIEAGTHISFCRKPRAALTNSRKTSRSAQRDERSLRPVHAGGARCRAIWPATELSGCARPDPDHKMAVRAVHGPTPQFSGVQFSWPSAGFLSLLLWLA